MVGGVAVRVVRRVVVGEVVRARRVVVGEAVVGGLTAPNAGILRRVRR